MTGKTRTIRLCYLSIVTVLLFLTLSCNKNNKEPNTFLMNMSGSTLESTDPAFAKDLYIMWTVHMMYNTLVETDEHLHLKPSLAKSWEVSEDGTI